MEETIEEKKYLNIIGWILTGLVIVLFSVLIGLLSFIFQTILVEAQEVFQNYPYLFLFIPLFGFISIWTYKNYFFDHPSTKKILFNIHDFTASPPFISVPALILFSGASQIFGLSTGREGTAINYGSVLMMKAHSILKEPYQKLSFKFFKQMGIAAGFSSLFGTPLAGILFGIEIHHFHLRKKWPFLISNTLASLIAFVVSEFLKTPHLKMVPFIWQDTSYYALFQLFGLALCIGIAGRITIIIFHSIEIYFLRSPYKTMLFSSFFILIPVGLIFKNQFLGMGVDLFFQSFSEMANWYSFPLKLLTTSFSSQTGFKGGEFTPLMIAGATLGSFWSSICNAPVSVMACLGMFGYLGCLMRIPLSVSLMSAELVGWSSFVPCFLVTKIALYFYGKKNHLFKNTHEL